jgi:sarcosine oxidase subunit alpha
VTANDQGDAVVDQLGAAGIEVAEVVDLRQPQQQLESARGRGKLAAVELSDGRVIEADLLVTAVGWTTPTSLLNMAGDLPVYEPRAARFLPGAPTDDVMATGEVVGDGSMDEITAHAGAVGAEAARRALWSAFDSAQSTPRSAPATPPSDEPVTIPPLPAADHPELFNAPSDGFVDFSEDVRGNDLALAVAEGYDSIELSKRYTTATMGPIQGKLELVNAVAIHAEATGATIAQTGTTTWRPPYAPISLAALAGRDDDPVRRSPMHDWHVEHKAVPLVAGQWIRPDHYGDPAAEVRNTRENVGIIDVSPLGKIDLRGPDVSKLLEFVYINRWSKLGIGRVRYGAMVGEDGVVFDDGVTARLEDDRYYMTTTSSGAGRVWQWLDEWMQTTAPWWDVRMTAVSDGYAAMNVAGPASRRLLERIVEDVDLSAEAFGYMQARTGTVAGVPGCVVLRIGFTGELSFELHVPAGFGLHVWMSLLKAGTDLGVAPFGIEAQRIMRLEKGHLIIGQDTDGLTTAHEAALGWAVRSDKADCAGMPELRWESETGPGRMLVAIQPNVPSLVPAEASQIVAADRIVGRVTSSRMSPTLGRSVCLALVDTEYAEPGAPLIIRLPDGTNAAATVMEHHAHFDPEGARLRG